MHMFGLTSSLKPQCCVIYPEVATLLTSVAWKEWVSHNSISFLCSAVNCVAVKFEYDYCLFR
jgi:hypothetical protein